MAGSTITLYVFLNDNAPAGGVNVNLTSDQPGIAPVPGVVDIPAGSFYTTVSIPTANVSATTAVNLTAAYAGHTEHTLFTLTVPVSSPPTADSVTPSSGSGTDATFTFAYSDANGASNTGIVYFLFNSTFNGVKACYGYYHQPSNSLYLADDSSSGVSGPISPGANQTAQNSQCVLNGIGVSVATSGNTLSLTVPIHFLSAFPGDQTVFLLAANKQNLNSGWQMRGAWNTGNAAAPAVVTVTVELCTGIERR